MVGLVGIAASKEDIDFKNLLSQMCESIKHEDRQKTEFYINKNICIGRVHLNISNPEQQPIFNEDKSMCIMMDGEIYDYQNIKDQLISKGHKFSIDNDPEFILHLYEEYGNNFVNKLNGNFSLVIWDDKLHKLLIVNDRYGIRPIYYANIDNKGCLLFGSEVKAILKANFKKTIDDRSIAEFFSFGYILGNKTFFQGIEMLPAASILTYINGQVSIEQYWDYDFNKKYSSENHSEKYYIEELSKLVLQSVERRMIGSKKAGVLLSGGLDSRTIVASINKEHYPIHTFTYGRPDCYDVRFAQMVANKLGTIHHHFGFTPEDMLSYTEKLVYQTDGMMNIIHAPGMNVYNQIDEFSDIVFHGYIGDTTTGHNLTGILFNLIDKEDNFNIFIRNCDYSSIDFLRNLFNENYFQKVEKNLNLSKDYIDQMGKNVEMASNRLMYYTLKDINHRLIAAGFSFIRNEIEVRTPFTDNDYIDFILTVPPKYKFEQMFYKRMILSTFPNLEDIPIQSTGVPLYKYNFLTRASASGNKIINSLTQKMFKTKLFYDKDKDLANYGEWIRNNKVLREYILSILLDKKTLDRGYFNQEYVRCIINDHMDNKKDYSRFIGLLVTFELWNRQFIDK